MAETTAVLDSNVFDLSVFDASDVIPAIFKVLVEPTYAAVASGQAVSVTLYIINNTTTPGRSYPLSPSQEPTVQFFDPSDVSLGAAIAMREVGQGIFSYTLSTTGLVSKGAYAALFTVTNGLLNTVSKKQVVFTMV